MTYKRMALYCVGGANLGHALGSLIAARPPEYWIPTLVIGIICLWLLLRSKPK